MKALLAIVVALGLASTAAEAGYRSNSHGHGHHVSSHGHRAHSFGHVQTYSHAPRHNSHGHVSTYRHVPAYVPAYSHQPAYKPAYAPTFSYGAPHQRVVIVKQISKPAFLVEPKQDLKSSEGPVVGAPIEPAPELAPEAAPVPQK